MIVNRGISLSKIRLYDTHCSKVVISNKFPTKSIAVSRNRLLSQTTRKITKSALRILSSFHYWPCRIRVIWKFSWKGREVGKSEVGNFGLSFPMLFFPISSRTFQLEILQLNFPTTRWPFYIMNFIVLDSSLFVKSPKDGIIEKNSEL